MWKNRSSFFAASRIGGILTAVSGLLVFGCTTGLTAQSVPSTAQQRQNSNSKASPTVEEVSQTREPNQNRAPESSSSPQVAEGLYWIGNTGLGLEVSRGRFRYYDEEGYKEWRDLGGLTPIKEGVIFDGDNYWCWSQLVPQNTVGSCTAQGWKTANIKAEEEPARVSPLEFSLGGVRLGDSAATIRRNLGEPNRISSNVYEGIRFQYTGLAIDLGEKGAFNMKSTMPRYCTPAGVCPGMSFSLVREIYGSPEVTDRGSEGRFMEYYSVIPEDTCWLKIALDSQERVQSIEVACQP